MSLVAARAKERKGTMKRKRTRIRKGSRKRKSDLLFDKKVTCRNTRSIAGHFLLYNISVVAGA